MSRLGRPIRNWRGFTLVEMLIALVLLALLMLVLTAALRSVGQVEDRVEQHVEVTDDYRLTAQLLQQLFGAVSARRHAVLQAGSSATMPFFDAGPNSVSWIGVMPARYGLGGRYYLHLQVEQGRLVLRYAPWNGGPGFSDWSHAKAQVLIAPVTSVALLYQEPITGIWSPVWPPAGIDIRDLPPTLLPSAVSVAIDAPGPLWPPIAAELVATFTSDPGVLRAEWGGS